MMSPFHALSRSALNSLAVALETNRLTAPFLAARLTGDVPPPLRQQIALELQSLTQKGLLSSHIAYMLRLLAEERTQTQLQRDQIDLVWTGHEIPFNTESRDTRIVVRELFSQAQNSVLISSYAIDRGQKSYELFQPLADRMDNNPSLQVRMFLNVQRPHRSAVSESILLREFADEFRKHVWPGTRMPEVFHDPRSLSTDPGPKACLHAKCVVVDQEYLLTTSANFTEAAHERNIEVGMLIRDRQLASALITVFESLVSRRRLCRIPGIN
jgi:phosphatidylserine/phosphatidylglycerophosphate/cardiolipin synthase-like enzyme